MIAKTKLKLDSADMKHKITIMRKGANAQNPTTGEWSQGNRS